MKLGLTLKNLNNRLTTQWLGAPAPRLILSRKTNQSIRSLTSKYHFPRLSLKYAEFEPLITNSATWQPPVKRWHVQVQNPAPINRFQARLEHWQANFLDRHEGLEIDLENPEAEPALPENHVYRQHRNMDLEENIANIFERRLNRWFMTGFFSCVSFFIFVGGFSPELSVFSFFLKISYTSRSDRNFESWFRLLITTCIGSDGSLVFWLISLFIILIDLLCCCSSGWRGCLTHPKYTAVFSTS